IAPFPVWLGRCTLRTYPGAIRDVHSRTGGLAMRRIVTWSMPLVLVALVSAGCIATRDWVNDNLGKRQGQIDDRFARTETTVRDVGDAARVAQSRAEAAHERAEAAHSRADEVNSRLSRLWTGRNKRNVVETVHVQFGFDRADL